MLPRSNLVDIQRDVPKCVPLESLRPWRGTGRRGQARFGVPPVVALVAPVLDLQPSGFMVRVCSNPQVQSLTRGIISVATSLYAPASKKSKPRALRACVPQFCWAALMDAGPLLVNAMRHLVSARVESQQHQLRKFSDRRNLELLGTEIGCLV